MTPLRWILALCLAFAASLRAQADREVLAPPVQAAVEAIGAFAVEFDQGRVFPNGPLLHGGTQSGWCLRARAAGVLEGQDESRLTNGDVLQKLLLVAEAQPSAPMAAAVLRLAAAGFGRSLGDRDALQLRDLGHWTLMRMQDQAAWAVVLAAAGCEGDGDRALQVAALRLLGQKGLPVFRAVIEGALLAPDPRARLAAVEALALQRGPASLPVLLRALGSERHPVVAQALVRTLLQVLQSAAADLPPAERERAVRAALRLLGQAGWRTDMDLVELAVEFPVKAAIPELIAVLERCNAEPDRLLKAVNQRASPLLRDRAHAALRTLTGALLPADKPAEWRAFWLQERDRLQVPERATMVRSGASTKAAFFGIPVTGGEIAFVIDTSGSMSEPFRGTAAGDGRNQRENLVSRLDAAKAQLLAAVQAMEPESRYHLLTFADRVRSWNQQPVAPTAATVRSLHEMLGRFQPKGSTNVHDALQQVLGGGELRFGELGKATVDEVFLLSDGLPTAGELRDPDELLAMVRELNRYQKVRINTVFSGTGRGAEFLRKLAEQNDGVFVQK